MLEAYLEILAILSTASSVVVSFAYIPQILKIHKIKKVDELSFPLFFLSFVSFVFWMLYGIALMNWPLIIADVFGGIGCGIIALQYLIYKER
jgi:MtN3 and saliva related transmembrane protein